MTNPTRSIKRHALPTDVYNRVVSFLPTKLVQLMNTAPRGFGVILVVAGGCIRDLAQKKFPNDIDVVLANTHNLDIDQRKEKAWQLATVLCSGTNTKAKETKHTITVPPSIMTPVPIQLLYEQPVGAPEDAIARIDFVINMASVFPDPSGILASHCHQGWKNDIDRRELCYNAIHHERTDPASHFQRLIRFVSEGYTIERHEISAVLTHFIKCYAPAWAPENNTKDRALALIINDILSKADWSDSNMGDPTDAELF